MERLPCASKDVLWTSTPSSTKLELSPKLSLLFPSETEGGIQSAVGARREREHAHTICAQKQLMRDLFRGGGGCITPALSHIRTLLLTDSQWASHTSSDIVLALVTYCANPSIAASHTRPPQSYGGE